MGIDTVPLSNVQLDINFEGYGASSSSMVHELRVLIPHDRVLVPVASQKLKWVLT